MFAIRHRHTGMFVLATDDRTLRFPTSALAEQYIASALILTARDYEVFA